MSIYISFFGKSQDFTAKYYDNNGPISDFNHVIKDFHLIESKYFTIDDIKNKEILAKYYFKSDGKNYCLLKLYSFAQALNGNRVAGSIYGVGFISDKNIQLTKENLALLQDAKNTFAKLSLDGLKFNKSNFSDDTDRIWKAIVHNEKGNLLNTLSLTPQINNGNAGPIAFYVKDLFAEAIKLNDRVSKQDTVYFSDDLDHLKRTQNKWGKDDFPIFCEEKGQYIPYKEPVIVPEPSQSQSQPPGPLKGNEDIAIIKAILSDTQEKNKLLDKELLKLKEQKKQSLYLIYSLATTIVLILAYLLLFTEKKEVAVAPVKQIHDTVYIANTQLNNIDNQEDEKKNTLTTLNEYTIYFKEFHSKDSVALKAQFEKIEALPYKKFNISIDKIKKLYNLKLDSIRLKLF
jgi:hypothetical protein